YVYKLLVVFWCILYIMFCIKSNTLQDVITITEGDTLHLNCSSVGNPSPSYTWTLPLNSSPSYSGSVLTIKSVGFEHEGQHICTVSNTVGTSFCW
uniref:Ig-like domain-containing protein n=1 Tax=Astatotilapia calliptera TaxID=8154 RepID=A0AAX7SPR1_ASTCA